MIRLIIISMCILSTSAYAQNNSYTDADIYRYTALFLKAIDGEPDAMFEVATTLSNGQHPLFHPVKGHQYFLKLSRQGDERALIPLIDSFMDPKHHSYSPSRAWFYAQRTDGISPLKRRFIEFLAGKKDSLLMLNTDSSTDPFYSVAHVFSYYPFTNLSSQQWQSITPHFNEPLLQPYLSYILPVLYSPTIDGNSLYPSKYNSIDDTQIDENGFYHLLPNKAQIDKVKVEEEGGRVNHITVLYSAEDDHSARLAHYAKHYQQYFDLVTQTPDTVTLEGHHLTLTIAIINNFIEVDYMYPNQPVLRGARHAN